MEHRKFEPTPWDRVSWTRTVEHQATGGSGIAHERGVRELTQFLVNLERERPSGQSEGKKPKSKGEAAESGGDLQRGQGQTCWSNQRSECVTRQTFRRSSK